MTELSLSWRNYLQFRVSHTLADGCDDGISARVQIFGRGKGLLSYPAGGA